MHISDSQVSANILTKCSKMSDVHRLNGVNENADKSIKEYPRTACGQGARLKFFKDGKFILELERTLEGERVSWVSVHQKTYFPPQSTASLVASYQPESTTSLSVSDDNSSIQSSPWQRDHTWKQNCPSRNISSELNFYYWKPKGMRSAVKSKKRRNPFSASSDFENNYVTNEGFGKVKMKTEKHTLIVIIQALIDKKIHISKQPRAEVVVSPRKRILREIEKDKLLVSDNCQKRSRSKLQSTNSSFTSIGKSTIPNGIEDNMLPVSRNGGYTITSLLTEDYISKKTPNNSPNHNSTMSQPIYRSPVSEDRWYSESVDRLRSIEINHADKCSVSPSYNPHQSFAGPYVYPFQPLRSYYGPRVYEREYMLPSIYIGSPMSLGVRPEAPSCSCSFEEDWERNKDKPLNLSKHPG